MEFPAIITLYNSLYTKNKFNFIPDYDIQSNIMLTKWLMREPHLLPILRPLIDYMFFLKPKHFYYLLYTHIPRQTEAPRIKKKGKRIKTKEDKVLTKMREIIGWSTVEMEKNMEIIEKVIIPEKKFWSKEFGFK